MLIQPMIDTGILTTHVKASHGGTAQTYAADMVKEIKVRFPVLNFESFVERTFNYRPGPSNLSHHLGSHAHPRRNPYHPRDHSTETLLSF